MSQALQTAKAALVMCRDRRASVPEFALYESIEMQLEYLVAVLDGSEKDRSKLKHIIVGHYGVREFEESDPEFASSLVSAQHIASQMAKGLKVQ